MSCQHEAVVGSQEKDGTDKTQEAAKRGPGIRTRRAGKEGVKGSNIFLNKYIKKEKKREIKNH